MQISSVVSTACYSLSRADVMIRNRIQKKLQNTFLNNSVISSTPEMIWETERADEHAVCFMHLLKQRVKSK